MHYLLRNLTAWAQSGVLLLNTALTVRSGSAGSHSKKGWETFTAKVIDVVDKYGGANLGETNGVGRGIVFMAWGAWAAKCVERLDKVRLFSSQLIKLKEANILKKITVTRVSRLTELFDRIST